MDAVPAEVDSALKWNEDKYMMEKEKEKGEKQPTLPGPARPSPCCTDSSVLLVRVQTPCLIWLVEGRAFEYLSL